MKPNKSMLVCGFALALWTCTAAGQIAINQSAVIAGGITLGDSAGYPATISVSGSYILTGNLDVSVAPAGTNGINITGSDVTLDLNGFSISDKNICTKANPGNSCIGGSETSEVLVNISGNRVTIKNGFVKGSHGSGVLASGDNVLLDHVVVSNNVGFGINCTGDFCISTVDSSSVLNGLTGFMDSSMSGGARVYRGTFNNNDVGVQVTKGLLEGVTASKNQTSGAGGSYATLRDVNALQNGGTGISLGAGVAVDSVSIGNGGDGFGGVDAMFFGDWAETNGGDGFDLNAWSCYSDVNAAGNAAQIVGGSALTGTDVTCP